LGLGTRPALGVSVAVADAGADAGVATGATDVCKGWGVSVASASMTAGALVAVTAAVGLGGIGVEVGGMDASIRAHRGATAWATLSRTARIRSGASSATVTIANSITPKAN